MVDELVDGLGKPLLRIAVGFLRALWFVAFELMFEFVGWWIGWPVCRLFSLGRFPEQRMGEQDQASWPVALTVEVVGLATLAALIYALSLLLGVLPAP